MHAEEEQRRIESLLAECLPRYAEDLSPTARPALATHLRLLMRWNRRVRLVGAADAKTLVERHVGESLFLGRLVELNTQRMLDIGSGAGFPGLALALAHPEINTTLVESQGRKAAFLRTVIREAGVETRVAVSEIRLGAAMEYSNWPRFDLVTCRALEAMADGPQWISGLTQPGCLVAFWVTEELATEWRERFPAWSWQRPVRIPGAARRAIVLAEPPSVPRGT